MFRYLATGACAIGRVARHAVPRGLLDDTVLGRIRMCLYLMIFLGPLIAGIGLWHQNYMNDLLRRGADAIAQVTRLTTINSKGTAYRADLAWTGSDGAALRLYQFSVSPQFAARIRQSGNPPRLTARIKFIADSRGRHAVVILDDQDKAGPQPIWLCLSLGLFGLIGTLVTSWLRARTVATGNRPLMT